MVKQLRHHRAGFHNNAVIERLNGLYRTVANAGISGFYATGDTGVANSDKQGNVFPYPTVNFPTSSPDVIAMGGTEIPAPQPALASYNPEAVWNDCCGAGGGGFSSVFGEPAYQSTSGIADPSGMRGVPDVSYNAALISSILIYESFDPTVPPGYTPIGGTSAATPQWAAIDAIANQADGNLGFLTPRLYQVYDNKAAYALAFHDITAGNNTSDGSRVTPPGRAGMRPPDWVHPDVHNLVTALASTTAGTAP
jgi:subtilase family serine protease